MNIMQVEGIDGFGRILLGMNFFFKLFGSLIAAKYLLEAVFLCQIICDFTNHVVVTNFNRIHEKLIITQLFKKFLAVYTTRISLFCSDEHALF
jgi:hypothetical protein